MTLSTHLPSKEYNTMVLSKEQIDAINKTIEQQTKKSLVEFDKTLDVVVDKLAAEGWTLPAEIDIYAVNVIGKSNNSFDLNGFLNIYFSQDDYSITKKIIMGF